MSERAVATRSDAYDIIRRDAIDGIERLRLQPERQLAEVRAEVERAIQEYQRRARLGEQVPLGDTDTMSHRVLRSITDLGPLTELLARDDVEEIFVEGARVTYLDTSGRLRGLAEPTTEDENRLIFDRLLADTERQLNAKHPMVQARVLDGTARLTAAIPPVADHLSATVRRYTVRDVTLDELVARDALSAPAASFLWALVQQRSRIVISGEPGAGKTTLATALLSAGPAGHCVRCCEEIRELSAPITHGAYYEVRPPGLDGTGEISLRDLVKFVLASRQRPQRLVSPQRSAPGLDDGTRLDISSACRPLLKGHWHAIFQENSVKPGNINPSGRTRNINPATATFGRGSRSTLTPSSFRRGSTLAASNEVRFGLDRERHTPGGMGRWVPGIME